MKKLFMMSCIIMVGLLGCSESGWKKEDLAPLDLVKYGIPITLQAPKGATVEVNCPKSKAIDNMCLAIKTNKFHVRVDMLGKEYLLDSAKTKGLERIQAKGNFGDLVLNEENGFVYQTKGDAKGKSYHFFYVIVRDSLQIELTDYEAVANKFTESEAKFMYEAVKASDIVPAKTEVK